MKQIFESFKEKLVNEAKEPTLVIDYYDNHNKVGVKSEKYYLNGRLYRIGAPAETYYQRNGELLKQRWVVNDYLHRTNGPADIDYHENGKVMYETWYLNDKEHRTDGPSFIRYNNEGDIMSVKYSVNGKELSEEEFNKKYKK